MESENSFWCTFSARLFYKNAPSSIFYQMSKLQWYSFFPSQDIKQNVLLKETRNSLKKWPLNLWWISNKTFMEVGNITKAANFKSFLHLNYKNTQLQFLLQFFFNIFIRQTLTDDFGGLHKKMNRAFPLSSYLDNWWCHKH